MAAQYHALSGRILSVGGPVNGARLAFKRRERKRAASDPRRPRARLEATDHHRACRVEPVREPADWRPGDGDPDHGIDRTRRKLSESRRGRLRTWPKVAEAGEAHRDLVARRGRAERERAARRDLRPAHRARPQGPAEGHGRSPHLRESGLPRRRPRRPGARRETDGLDMGRAVRAGAPASASSARPGSRTASAARTRSARRKAIRTAPKRRRRDTGELVDPLPGETELWAAHYKVWKNIPKNDPSARRTRRELARDLDDKDTAEDAARDAARKRRRRPPPPPPAASPAPQTNARDDADAGGLPEGRKKTSRRADPDPYADPIAPDRGGGDADAPGGATRRPEPQPPKRRRTGER